MKTKLKLPAVDVKKILNTLGGKIKRTLWTLGRDAFLLILIFVLLDIFLGEILFYRYILVVNLQEPEVSATPVKFKDSLYESVVEEWGKRDDIFRGSLKKNHQDPFL